jgi:hypothetical protein
MAVLTSAVCRAATALPRCHFTWRLCQVSLLVTLPAGVLAGASAAAVLTGNRVWAVSKKMGLSAPSAPCTPITVCVSPAGRRGRGGVCHGGGCASRHLPVLQLGPGWSHHHRAVRAPGSPLLRARAWCARGTAICAVALACVTRIRCALKVACRTNLPCCCRACLALCVSRGSCGAQLACCRSCRMPWKARTDRARAAGAPCVVHGSSALAA